MDDAPPRLVVLGSTVTALAVARNAAALGMRPIIVDTCSGIATSTRIAQVEIWEGRAEKELCSRLAGVPGRGRAWLIAKVMPASIRHRAP
jgi:NADPH-dependent 2,4-dienoyl-CoA reductase/sulfur reductase-like enzyme